MGKWFSLQLLILFLLIFCTHNFRCNSLNSLSCSLTRDEKADDLMPAISPTGNPQPLFPLLAPSPLTPFTNNTVPKLSGLCSLDFDAVESMMSMTAIDCFTVFAPYLANVVCCPQLEATLAILIGQSSKKTKLLALNRTHAQHCLSDFDQILVGQGASNNLQQICSISPSNLTIASCPVVDVNEFEKTVDSSTLLAACGKIDVVNECCQQVCQNAILEAAKNLASKAIVPQVINPFYDDSRIINDCKRAVLVWLASKLDASHAKQVLRGLSNCNTNKVCPLVFPKLSSVKSSCGDGMSNQSLCCNAMANYVSHLQKQIFLTNLQALNCATSLGIKLQKANVTTNVYKLCHVTLQDFSLQANGMQESGCLLPSLPSDATFDKYSGVSFLCDLNDQIPAPWPSPSQLPNSSCNKTVKIPALPAAASAQTGLYNVHAMFLLLYAVAFILVMII